MHDRRARWICFRGACPDRRRPWQCARIAVEGTILPLGTGLCGSTARRDGRSGAARQVRAPHPGQQGAEAKAEGPCWKHRCTPPANTRSRSPIRRKRAMTSKNHSAYVVGYNVQFDTQNYIIVAPEVSNVGIDNGCSHGRPARRGMRSKPRPSRSLPNAPTSRARNWQPARKPESKPMW
jgi:hypothetical protein